MNLNIVLNNQSNLSGVVNVSCSGNPAANKVDYYIDNVLQVTRTVEPFSWSWNTANHSDGSHTLKAVGTYKNSRTQVESISVTIANSSPTPDTTAPTVPGSFAKSASTETSITTTWNASTDAVGVAGYNTYRDGIFVAKVPSSPYIFGGLTCGTTYSLSVDAEDAAGNKSAKSTISAAT